MTPEEMRIDLNKKIGTGIEQISVSKIAKVMAVTPADIHQRLSGTTNITKNYYNRIIEAYDFIIEAQKRVLK